MGAAPSLGDLYHNHGLAITLIYCFAAAFPTLYRLEGPFKDEGADEIVRTEIWDTVKRRGVIGNIMMVSISCKKSVLEESELQSLG